MCGIIGYTGKSDAEPVLIEGLSRLEYRGYDSAGIAVLNGDKIKIHKSTGRVDSLADICKKSPLQGCTGIGHTRWATHGRASAANSHPHTNSSKTVAVVHNGIIENHTELRQFLAANGYKFVSETDSEVIPHLLDYHIKSGRDFNESFLKTVRELKGSFAISSVCRDAGDKILSARKGSPIVIGEGEGEMFVSSDIYSISDKTDVIYVLGDNEVAEISRDCVEFSDFDGNKITKTPSEIKHKSHLEEAGGYDHYMLKEIHEQPRILKSLLSGEKTLSDIKNTPFLAERVKRTDKIYLLGCGTAYNAAMTGGIVMRYLCPVNVCAVMASEFAGGFYDVDDKTLVIAVTQSGETADTLSAMDFAAKRGAVTVAITNTEYSRADTESDFTFYTSCGREVSVASTKAYAAQLAVLYSFGVFLCNRLGGDVKRAEEVREALLKVTSDVHLSLGLEEEMKTLADHYAGCRDIYYIGRGSDFVTAAEGALKMKEITYIHSEAYPMGELKHGPIALIDRDTPVIAVDCHPDLHIKTESNLREVVTRGADAVCFCPDGITHNGVRCIHLPKTHWITAPFSSVVPLQLLAYYTSIAKGCDVDKPRNLAKSVTVE